VSIFWTQLVPTSISWIGAEQGQRPDYRDAARHSRPGHDNRRRKPTRFCTGTRAKRGRWRSRQDQQNVISGVTDGGTKSAVAQRRRQCEVNERPVEAHESQLDQVKRFVVLCNSSSNSQRILSAIEHLWTTSNASICFAHSFLMLNSLPPHHTIFVDERSMNGCTMQPQIKGHKL
jgi:hypothetical protein